MALANAIEKIVGAESISSICTEAPKGAYQFKDKSFDVALRRIHRLFNDFGRNILIAYLRNSSMSTYAYYEIIAIDI